MLAVIGALAAGLVPAATALAVTEVKVTGHSAAPSAVAGDPFSVTANIETLCSIPGSCDDVQLQVFYIDRNGVEQSVTVPGLTSGNKQTLTAQIPGDEVRYPELRYRLVVSRAVSSLREVAVQRMQYPLDGTMVSVPVDIVIRGQLLLPGGSPAANMDVTAIPANVGLDDVWRARTDSAGRYNFSIDPTSKPYFTDLFTRQKYLNITVTAFDGWNQGVWPPVGAHTWIGMTRANFGEPLLDAADRQFQDVPKTTADYVHVDPEVASYRAGEQTCTEWYPTGHDFLTSDQRTEERVCRWDETLPYQKMRVANNIGGGQEFVTEWSHDASVATSSSMAKKVAAAGSAWTVEGELQHEVEEATNIAIKWTRGPQANDSMDLWLDVHHRAVYTCQRWRSGEQVMTYCNRPNETLTAQRIVGAAPPPESWTGIHDQAREKQVVGPCKTTDYLVPAGAELSSDQTTSRTRGWTIEAGGSVGVVEMTFKQKYSKTHGVTTSYTWKPQADGLYNYLYVRDGRSPWEGRDDGPLQHPYKAYTHSSSIADAMIPADHSSACPIT